MRRIFAVFFISLSFILSCVNVSFSANITIVHWQHHFEPRAKVVESLIKEFTQENPGIEVKFESIPYDTFFDKLVTSLSAGTGPDVFQIPVNILYQFVNQNLVLPIPSDLMPLSEIRNTFIPWTIRMSYINGKYWGFPTDVQPFMLFVNNKLLEDAGLNPAKAPKTWKELEDMARKTTKFTGDKMVQAGLNVFGNAYHYYWTFVYQNVTKSVVDPKTLKVGYNSPEGYEAWQFLADLILKYHVDDPTFLTNQDKFALGKAALDIHEAVYKGNLDMIAPNIKYNVYIPPTKTGKPSTVGTNWVYVVSSKTKNPNVAFKWASYLTSEKAEKEWVIKTGSMPSRKTLLDDVSLQKDSNMIAIFKAIKFVRPLEDLDWDPAWEIREECFQNIVLKNIDVKKAVDLSAQKEEALYSKKFQK